MNGAQVLEGMMTMTTMRIMEEAVLTLIGVLQGDFIAEESTIAKSTGLPALTVETEARVAIDIEVEAVKAVDNGIARLIMVDRQVER